MRTATGLALIGAGAILAFAVSARIPGVNLQAAGVIVMLAGLAGLALRGRAGGWLRRRVVLRRPAAPAGTPVLDEVSYPAAEPAIMASQLLEEAERADAAAAGIQAGRPAATQADGTRPGHQGGQEAAAQKSPAAAVLRDLFTS
jgi:hypothetical protein